MVIGVRHWSGTKTRREEATMAEKFLEPTSAMLRLIGAVANREARATMLLPPLAELATLEGDAESHARPLCNAQAPGPRERDRQEQRARQPQNGGDPGHERRECRRLVHFPGDDCYSFLRGDRLHREPEAQRGPLAR